LDLDTFYLDAGRTGRRPPARPRRDVRVDAADARRPVARPPRARGGPAGFGDSEKPIRAYDPAFYAAWLLDFLDAAGVERAVLAGNSMGGRIAIEAGLRAPTRVEASCCSRRRSPSSASARDAARPAPGRRARRDAALAPRPLVLAAPA
jgi:pimeloyl-ACP methyl ester carboxylesterase